MKLINAFDPGLAEVIVVGTSLDIKAEPLTGQYSLKGPSARLIKGFFLKANLPITGAKVAFIDISDSLAVFGGKVDAATVAGMHIQLNEEIGKLARVKTIFALGTTGTQVVLNNPNAKVNDYSGKIHEHGRYGFISTIHPMAIGMIDNSEEIGRVQLEMQATYNLAKASLNLRASKKPSKPKVPRDHKVVRTIEQARWLFQKLEEEPLWAFDYETTSLDYLEAKILCLAVSWKEHTGVILPLVGEECRDIWTTEEHTEVFMGMKTALENESKKIAHNGKYDVQVAFTHGIVVNNFYCDTMIMHYLIDENMRHGLELLSKTYTDSGGYDDELYRLRAEIAAERKIKLADLSYDMLPEEALWEYAAYDADVTMELYNTFKPRIIKEELTELLFKHYMPLVRLFIKVEHYGVSIDRKHLDSIILEYAGKIEEALVEIRRDPEIIRYVRGKKAAYIQERGDKWENSKHIRSRTPDKDEYTHKKIETVEFNPGSTKQLKELFIDQLGLPVISTTDKGNPQFNIEAMEAYANYVDTAKTMSRYSKIKKLYSTFMLGLRDKLRKDGRLHTSFNVHTAVTGRLSSSGPNLQNIPNKNNNPEDAVPVRNSFVADPGCTIIEADYAQAEFRMWGQLTGDPVLLADLEAGIDIHKSIAALGFGIAEEDVTAVQRGAAKTIVFGTMYGRSAKSVALQLGISEVEAKKIQGALLVKYRVAAAWLKRMQDDAKSQGYVRGFFGQRRHLAKSVSSPVKGVFNTAMRQAQNSPIQGSASQMNCFGALNIDNLMREAGLPPINRVTMLIHDAIIVNVQDEHMDQVIEIIKKGMLYPHPTVTAPLGIDLKIGKKWGDAEEKCSFTNREAA